MLFFFFFFKKDGIDCSFLILVGENTICNQVVTLPTMRHLYDLVEDIYVKIPHEDSILKINLHPSSSPKVHLLPTTSIKGRPCQNAYH